MNCYVAPFDQARFLCLWSLIHTPILPQFTQLTFLQVNQILPKLFLKGPEIAKNIVTKYHWVSLFHVQELNLFPQPTCFGSSVI